MNISLQEYEEIYSHNQSFALKTLRSYTKGTLESVGMPVQGFDYMGAAIGLAMEGARLDLNKSKTLALEFEDVDKPERALYFRFNLDW